MRTGWGGGQTGYVHTSAKYFIGTPLTLVSTWDGAELSLVREHHQLRAARRLDIEAGARALDVALAELGDGMTSAGQGLYRVIDAGARADAVASAAQARGVRLRRFPGGKLGVIPPLDRAVAAAQALGAVLKDISKEKRA